jgi:Secretion system C-terminal sorting domain
LFTTTQLPGSIEANPSSLLKTIDNGYITSGFTALGYKDYKLLITKYDAAGNTCNNAVSTIGFTAASDSVLGFIAFSTDITTITVSENPSIKRLNKQLGDSVICRSGSIAKSAVQSNQFTKYNDDKKLEVIINTNPVQNAVLNISVRNPKNSDLLLRIYDIYGKKVYIEKVSGSRSFNSLIPVTSLVSGLYILSLTDGKVVRNIKFVK